MNIQPQVQLKTTAVLNIPVQSYKSDFTFIINGDKFNTSYVISDLISPVISNIHQNDPTASIFTISTVNQGDFSYVLKLATFRPFTIPDDEIPFFAEIIEKLGNDSIDISNLIQGELTNDNIITYLEQHEKFSRLYKEKIDTEIDYASSHFFELCEEHKEEMKRFKFDTIEKIVSNANLRLKSEDQLVSFINYLYEDGNKEYLKLYGYVIFTNISTAAIGEFIDHVPQADLTEEAWKSITRRLRQPIPKSQMIDQPGRYNNNKRFLPKGEKNFDGIIRHLLAESNGNITEKVNITASSNDYLAVNVTHFDQSDDFCSSNAQNSWICFDFKDSRIVPTNYQIKSYNCASADHPKTWVIEGKKDENSQFENLGGESNCSYLNGQCVSHVFQIKNSNEKEFRFIRMRLTGPNWCNRHYLQIGSFEIYGTLIE